MNQLLTIDDLAARWQVTRERAFRRIKGEGGLKAINLGTPKFPELRFRLETVQSWEARAESTSALAPQDEGSAPPAHPRDTLKKIVGRRIVEPRTELGTYRGKVK